MGRDTSYHRLSYFDTAFSSPDKGHAECGAANELRESSVRVINGAWIPLSLFLISYNIILLTPSFCQWCIFAEESPCFGLAGMREQG